MAQLTGRCSVKINGQLIRSKPGAKLNLGGVTREAVLGDNGVDGFVQKTAAPYIEGTFTHGRDTDLQALHDLEDGSVSFETDTGKGYILRNAWSANPPELTSGEGEVTFRFEGVTCEETT
ncbi:MAG: phage tail tube protein [Gammaproteobacteria bacterium]